MVQWRQETHTADRGEVAKLVGQPLRIRLICIITRFVRQVSDCVYTAASLVDVGALCTDL